MKTNRKTSLRVLAIALLVIVIFPLATVRRALAYGDGALAAGVIMVRATSLTAKTLICTPVAAFQSSEPDRSFTTAFKSCWDWRPDSSTTEPSERVSQTTALETETSETAHGEEAEASSTAEAM